MGVWSGPYFVAVTLLTAGGALKALRPDTTVGALRASHVPAGPVLVRVGGAAEAALGVAVLVGGAPVLAVLVAASYVAFTAFVAVALVRGTPLGSCGCFGAIDTPPTLLHVVVNLTAAAVAAAVAAGPGGSLAEVLAGQPWAGVPFLVFTGTATHLVFVALTALPQALASEAPTR